MNHSDRKLRRKAGGALLTALVIALITAAIIGATLSLSSAHFSLGYTEAQSESAVLMADAGINDELSYIGLHIGNTDPSQISSQPVVANGETQVYPGEGTPIKGRKGALVGTDGCFWVYSSQDKAGTIPWDGKSDVFWITARSNVRGAWKKVQVQAVGPSMFTLYAIFALANYGNGSPAISLQSSDVIITGIAGTNGSISNNSSYPSLKIDNGLNANQSVETGTQFSTANLTDAATGTIFRKNEPVVFPLSSTMLSRTFGLDSSIDPWAYVATHSLNTTGVYTFRPNAGSTVVNTTNCQPLAGGVGAVLTNTGGNLGSWASTGASKKTIYSVANVAKKTGPGSLIEVTLTGNPTIFNGQTVTIAGVEGTNSLDIATNGTWTITMTGKKSFTLDGSSYPPGANYTNNTGTVLLSVRALIFTPGDYYFSNIKLPFNAQTQLFIDPYALSNGGTPGQVRFWINDTSGGAQNDNIQIQVNVTGVADPSLFRIYIGKKGKSFQFSRPSNPTDYLGVPITTDFNVYGGVYAVSNAPGDTSSGSTIVFDGPTATGSPRIVLTGSLLADSINFNGNCKIVFTSSSYPIDPSAGASVIGGYSDGG